MILRIRQSNRLEHIAIIRRTEYALATRTIIIRIVGHNRPTMEISGQNEVIVLDPVHDGLRLGLNTLTIALE